MKHILLYNIFISLLIFAGNSGHAETRLSRTSINKYTVSFLLPTNWKKKETDIGYKHIITCARGRHTSVTISVSTLDEKVREKWDTWETWYLDARGSKLRKIINKKNVTLHRQTTGTLNIFEFTQNGRKYLQRLLVVPYENTMVIIECVSSHQLYYNYDKIFNAIMWSLRF